MRGPWIKLYLTICQVQYSYSERVMVWKSSIFEFEVKSECDYQVLIFLAGNYLKLNSGNKSLVVHIPK